MVIIYDNLLVFMPGYLKIKTIMKIIILTSLFIFSNLNLKGQSTIDNQIMGEADFEYYKKEIKVDFESLLQTIKQTCKLAVSCKLKEGSYVSDIEFYANNSTYDFWIVVQLLDATTYIFHLETLTFYQLMISLKTGELDETFIELIHKELELPLAIRHI